MDGGTDRRVSSPAGLFSILITSAPMSASINVQVGPAITCVRSTTFNPVSGPIRVLNVILAVVLEGGADVLLPAPHGRTLIQEGIHAFAEVLAGVAQQDQVLVLGAWPALAQATHRLLGRLQRQRRHSGDRAGELVGAALQGSRIL